MSELLGQLSTAAGARRRLACSSWPRPALLVGVVLPGTSVLVALGYFSHLGVVPLGAAIAVAACAAVAGTQLSYSWDGGAPGGRSLAGAPCAPGVAPRGRTAGKAARARLLGEHGRRLLVRRGAGPPATVARQRPHAGSPARGLGGHVVPCLRVREPAHAGAWAATLVTLSRLLAPEVIHRIHRPSRTRQPSPRSPCCLVFLG